MDFRFTDEQQEIRAAIKKLLSELVTDLELKALAKDGKWFAERAWKALADAGMLGLSLPESVGGAGMGLFELVLLLGQVGRTVAPLPAVATLVSAARPIAAFGTEEQKQRLLPGVVTGETILSAALVNYDSVDARTPTATATKVDGGYAVTGTFTNVPFVAEATRILLAAKVGTSIGVFLLDPKAKGVTVTRQLGTNGEPLAELVLAGAVVASTDVLGDEASGRAILDRVVDETTLALCAVEHGVAEGALYMTANYAKERKQFGVPIGTFQGVTQRLGDAYIDLEAMKVTLFQATFRMSEGLDHTSALAVAKFWASEGGARITAAAQHIHGGMGFDRDYAVHRYFLTSKHLEFTLGSAPAQLARLGELVCG